MEMLSNSRQLRWLSCSFMLGLVTPCSLACLSNPSAETLQHLSLLDHQLGMYGWDLFGASGFGGKRKHTNHLMTRLLNLFRSPHHAIRAGSFIQSSLPGFGFLWFDVWALWCVGLALPNSAASPLSAAKRRCSGVQAVGGDRYRRRLESTGNTSLPVSSISVDSPKTSYLNLAPSSFCLSCLSFLLRCFSGPRERQSARVHHGPGGGQRRAPSGPKAQPTSGAPPPRQLPLTSVWRHFGINITAVQQNTDSLPASEG